MFRLDLPRETRGRAPWATRSRQALLVRGWNNIHDAGIYLLTNVCRQLPFSTHQRHYQAKRNPTARKDFAVWKDEEINAFVVDMAPFSVWIKQLWEGNFTTRVSD